MYKRQEQDRTNVLTATPIIAITTATTLTRITSTIGEPGIIKIEVTFDDKSTSLMGGVSQTRGGTAQTHRQTPGIIQRPQIKTHFKKIGLQKRQGTA